MSSVYPTRSGDKVGELPLGEQRDQAGLGVIPGIWSLTLPSLIPPKSGSLTS